VDDWLKVAIGAAIGGVLALIAAVATGWFSFASKDEELKVHLVEIAIGILRADPKTEDVAGARGWAMDAIDKYSGLRPFTAAERDALTKKSIGGALPADPEWKKAFEGLGKDGFLIVPPKGLGKDVVVPPKEPKDGSVIIPKGFTLPKDMTEPLQK
jgi:hypothetical protein